MFDVLYSDCPWSFNDKGSRVAPDNDACAMGYPTMPTSEIMDLPIAEMMNENSVSFGWTTWTHLLNGDAMKVFEAWGFEGKVVVPWVKLSDSPGESKAGYKDFPTVEWFYQSGLKVQIGAGHYFRACAEPLVIATRGSMTVPAELRVPGVIAAPRPGGHSTKPEMVRDLIERLYPGKKYLELFARNVAPRENWRFSGDQAGV